MDLSGTFFGSAWTLAAIGVRMVEVIVVTGSGGLVGSETVRYYAERDTFVVGIDNDMRAQFFGEEASTAWNVQALQAAFPETYRHIHGDIRNSQLVNDVFCEFGSDIRLVVHAAAQPSHDWAAQDPVTDFTVNANATLLLLEATRQHCPEAVFIFTSTNKVYGDRPNSLALHEAKSRLELDESHRFYRGIDETMSIDATTHSLFGVSKAAADLLVQEYGRYFGLKTVTFRGGCLTGPAHSGAELHGFLAYLMKCTLTGHPYRVFGYKGKQVRDNIHSHDLVAAFDAVYRAPRPGEVYNLGGGRGANCSMLEAIEMCEDITKRRLNWSYEPENRAGDHMWWISDFTKFQGHYPDWGLTYGVRDILEEMHVSYLERPPD